MSVFVVTLIIGLLQSFVLLERNLLHVKSIDITLKINS